MKVCIIVGRELPGVLKTLKRYKHEELTFKNFSSKILHFKPKGYQSIWEKFKKRKRTFEKSDFLIENNYHFELFITHTLEREPEAAATTQFMITEFNPDLVVNFGMANMVNKELKRNILYTTRALVHYDYDASQALGHYSPGVYPEFKNYLIPTVSPLSDLILEYKTSLGGEIPFVVCASGNKFIVNEDSKQYLLNQFKEVDICDMTSVGVFNTCALNNKYCLILKGITDNIHNGTVLEDFEFDRNSAACFEEALNLIEFLAHH